MIHQSIHLFCFLVIAMILITYYTNENENVKGQEQQPTNITANLETMIKQNERIIKQNDETAIQNRADTFIATTALLVSLSLVIYGFQISRQEKITQKGKRHYQIIILSLVFPVFILIGVAWFAIDEALYPHYNIMSSLLLIPALLVTVLMFSNWIG
jgi:cytochrome bd-type quinol oxidase subunit 2